MAFEKRLDGVWYLTDGILDPFPTGGAVDVMEAVTAADFAPDPYTGMNLMACEWLFDRRWSYSIRFDTPREHDGHVWLRFERLWSAAEVIVNGQSAGKFAPGEVFAEVTPLLAAEENLLEVRFDPVLRRIPEEIAPPLGLGGGVYVVTGSLLCVNTLKSRASHRGIDVTAALTVDEAGVYAFDYLASSDGEKRGAWRFMETLGAGPASVRHELVCESRGEILDVRLDIVRNGVGCARMRFQAMISDGNGPARILAVRTGAFEEGTAAALRSFGADGVFLPDEPVRRLDADCLYGLRVVCAPPLDSCPACADLKAAAGKEAVWPPRGPVWRLRNRVAPDIGAFKTLYGDSAVGGGDAFGRVSRYHQADRIMRSALDARLAGSRAAFFWNASGVGLYTEGITERGGRARMACAALRRAWQAETAFFPDAPDTAQPGETLSLHARVLSDAADGRTYVLRVSACDISGARLAWHTGRAAAGDGADLNVTVPAEGVVILRCRIADENGREAGGLDQIVCVRGEGAPRGAVLSAAKTRITRDSGLARNAGSSAALAPGCCLLPGETGDLSQEWVNGTSV